MFRGSGFDGTIVPDLETNELVVMATSESLDFIDALIKQVDVAESTDPQELPQAHSSRCCTAKRRT